ncbi:MAG: hypothetical protein GF308_06715 [Candidatus Heimdallarchaeota archaeon]|nr:hypothetical protein [Candidatus Heimdallarchaeota archaeon]
MMKIRLKRKTEKKIKGIIESAKAEKVSKLFKSLTNSHELLEKIPESEQESYEEYFTEQMNRELELLRIELKKIEVNYKEVIYKTKLQEAKFKERLSEKGLDQEMREFYLQEYLNILKPEYTLEQILENFQKYLEVLTIIKDEFHEWFFLGRLDYLKQLLKQYIVNDGSPKKREIWIYKKNEKELTLTRKKKMYKRVGLKFK